MWLVAVEYGGTYVVLSTASAFGGSKREAIQHFKRFHPRAKVQVARVKEFTDVLDLNAHFCWGSK